MSFGSKLTRTPVRRNAAGAVGIVAIVLGVWLFPRPLTALVVCICAVGCALVVAAIWIAFRAAGTRRLLAIPAAAIGVAMMVWLPVAAVVLPIALAALCVTGAAWLCVRAIRRKPGRTWVIRATDLSYALAAILGAGLVLAWPDAATLVCAFAWSIALIAVGIWLFWRALRASLVSRRTAGVVSTAHDREARSETDSSETVVAVEPVVRGRVLRTLGGVLVLCLMVAATWGSVALSSDSARVDDFYEWQGVIPDKPGQVLRVETYLGEVPAGATAVRVLYATTHRDGSPALASAVIAYPAETRTANSRGRDVLAWQHGTTGVAESCGPSVGPAALTEYAIPGISRAIERDWVVVATDYPGQGTSGRFPYLVGQGEGRATLDGIRAAQQLEAAHASNHAWVWGHSQGGHATLWAGEIADEYAPEIEILGVAALSAAADPLAMATKITGAGAGPLAAVVIAFVVLPYLEEYDEVTLAATVHPAGQGIARAFADRCVTAGPTLVSVLAAAAIGAQDGLYRLNLAEGPVHEVLRSNIASGKVPAPLFLGQGDADEVVPITIQRALNTRVCEMGRPVETHEYPGRTHMGVIAAGAPLIDDLYAWADRVAAGERPSSCSR